MFIPYIGLFIYKVCECKGSYIAPLAQICCKLKLFLKAKIPKGCDGQ